MREIALHLLDIVENSVTALAKNIRVEISVDLCLDKMSVIVEDNGKGMDAETVARVVDPFVTSRTTRKVGLGIPLLKAAAEACNGTLELQSTPGKGTRLKVTFQHSHIDRMPLGDLASTFLSMLIAHPDVHWLFVYRSILSDGTPGAEFIFDDRPVKDTLEDVPLTEPDVLAYLRETLQSGVASVDQTLVETIGKGD